MRILLYHPYSLENGCMSVMLDEAIEYLQEPDNSVLFVTCSGQIAPCDLNQEASPVRCLECRFSTSLLLKLYRHPRLIQKPLSAFLDRTARNRVDALLFDYSSLEQVKTLTYRGVNIGLGVVSSYVSTTRNLNPEFNRANIRFLDAALRAAARVTEASFAAIREFRPDRICLFNGRYGGVRPLFEVARNKSIRTTVLEVTFSSRREVQRKIRIPDAMPHDIDKVTPLIEDYWKNWSRDEDKETVSAAFFAARRNGETASDSVYIGLQERHLLPANWDGRKRNFVVFNSSEDEFFSIGESFDRHKIFPSQIEGIHYLVKKCAADPSIHLYLRVHPNLQNIRFRYHTALSELFAGQTNITVIPAGSPISTYGLMDKCEKVFVFGSMTGVEAAYWGKPVVLLGGALYMHLDVAYVPRSLSDLDSLVFEPLSPKPRRGALKYALYLFGERGQPSEFISFNFKQISFWGKTLPIPLCYAYRGSILPYLCVVAIFRLLNGLPHLLFKKVTMRQLSAEKQPAPPEEA